MQRFNIRSRDDDLGVNQLLVKGRVLALLVAGGHQGVALLLEPFPDAKLVLCGAEKAGNLKCMGKFDVSSVFLQIRIFIPIWDYREVGLGVEGVAWHVQGRGENEGLSFEISDGPRSQCRRCPDRANCRCFTTEAETGSNAAVSPSSPPLSDDGCYPACQMLGLFFF